MANLTVVTTGTPMTTPIVVTGTAAVIRLTVITDPAPVDTVAWADFGGVVVPARTFEGK